MEHNKTLTYIKAVLQNMPAGWLSTTTHRLDIYNEELAKTQFLDQFEVLFNKNNNTASALNGLPTAYDYIRLGHPLSCVLEWTIAKQNNLNANQVICFSSKTIPLLAILRTNLLQNKNTRVLYKGNLPICFDIEVIQNIYGYKFDLVKIENLNNIDTFNGSTIYLSQEKVIEITELNPNIDFYINLYDSLGSILLINGEQNSSYISDIQHVRRRETIAMTPADCLTALNSLVLESPIANIKTDDTNKPSVLKSINNITGTNTKALVASSGLSIQYAIMMGLIHNAVEEHKGKTIKIVVPPNCYGGTNDQARRIAACIENVEIVDLAVDGDDDMVSSIDDVLNNIANEDAVPYIIAEIPTNPRVQVPGFIELKDALTKIRKTANNEVAIDPVFILDQTFCPNVHFLGEDGVLASVRTISFASGSKFPSGGKCTAGYCLGNKKAIPLMKKIEQHLAVCDNEATALQYKILAEQLPSMKQRINDAYNNTREFVTFIHEVLPKAKINFVTEDLVKLEFTPSVFSLDLPTKGDTDEERETYKRALNLKLINLMITKIPHESKNCVSYGQLKGCYWTIPATSTQGTTKEGDKDYIARVSLSANMDLELHKKVFLEFVESI